MSAWRRRAGDAGSASLEFAVLAPVLLLVVALVVAGGRLATARTGVTVAAQAAARQASLARTAPGAQAAAAREAASALAGQGLACASTAVTVSAGGFGTAVGQPASVSVTVRCDVPLGDLGLPGPGAVAVSGEATSVLDTYRERS